MGEARTYEDGLREGEIRALQRVAHEHGERLNLHSARLGRIERGQMIVLGFLIALQALPALRDGLSILRGVAE